MARDSKFTEEEISIVKSSKISPLYSFTVSLYTFFLSIHTSP